MTEDPDQTNPDLLTSDGLAAALQARRRARQSQSEIPVVQRGGKLPLSTAQKSIWFAHLVAPDPASFNVVQAERLLGRLNTDRLKQAFDDLVARHEILRLKYETDHGAPVCAACDRIPELEIEDQRGSVPTDRDKVAQDLLDAFARQPFDLTHEAPIRARLFQFSDDDALLAIVLHHITCDEWSIATLRSELATLYRQRVGGMASHLPELKLQYADVAAYEQRAEEQDKQVAVLDRWADRLRGARPDDTLPVDAYCDQSEGIGGEVSSQLPKDLSLKLDTLGREHGATPFMTMLAVSLFLLHAETRKADVTIATQVAGRVSNDTSRIVGPFTNTAAIRSTVKNGSGFLDVLASVRDQIRDVLTHQDVRFESLLRRIKAERFYETPPFARVMFTHRDSFGGLDFGADVRGTPMKSAGKWAKRDLWVSVIDNPDGRRLRIVYNAALYRPERLQRVLRDFEHLIEQIVVGHAPQLSGLAPAGPLEAIAPPAQANESVPSTFQREGPAMATLNKVAAIWSETLRVDAPSEDVSFFNQGGDSLLLLRLIHRIEEEFGQSFPLGEAFQSPTIGHIAACLERSPQRLHQPRDRDILLEPLLRDRPTRTCLPKFFFVSGGGGHVAPFAQIARLLEDRWEMIGVKDPALFAQEPAIANIEDLASRMMRAVLSADANGPWILAGYSAGGRTVYEIARQLRDAGGAAGCVVIDAGVSENGLANATLRMMRKMKRTGRVAVRRVDDEFARLRESADADGLRDKERRHYRRVSDVQHGRLLRYTPKPSDTPVALVRAVASGRRVKDQDYGWSALTHFVSAFNTPGDHFNCFRAPHQGAFASSLAQALDAVAARVWHDPPNPKVRTDDS